MRNIVKMNSKRKREVEWGDLNHIQFKKDVFIGRNKDEIHGKDLDNVGGYVGV